MLHWFFFFLKKKNFRLLQQQKKKISCKKQKNRPKNRTIWYLLIILFLLFAPSILSKSCLYPANARSCATSTSAGSFSGRRSRRVISRILDLRRLTDGVVVLRLGGAWAELEGGGGWVEVGFFRFEILSDLRSAFDLGWSMANWSCSSSAIMMIFIRGALWGGGK